MKFLRLFKKLLILTILIFIILNSIFVFLLANYILMNGHAVFSIPIYISNGLIIIWLFLILAIPFSIIINFKYFLDYLLKNGIKNAKKEIKNDT